jgi:hypothetical protein
VNGNQWHGASHPFDNEMLNLEFKLKDGRQIFLEMFLESKTYAGLLEGKPDAAVNRDVLNSHASCAKTMWPNEPYVTLGIDSYKSRLAETLPGIICAAQFISYEPAVDPKRAGSSLVVIWFQEEMFPLLQGENADWLKDVAWKQVARDFDW